MSKTARFLLAAALLCAAIPVGLPTRDLAYGQAIPALPDSERRTTYTISAATGPYDVGFHIYGTGTDYANWVEVWLDGVLLTPATDWTLALQSGTLATAARPLTNARVTLTTARTGTLQIVGAERPRRLSQLTEGTGVTARDVNRFVSDLAAVDRERWDRDLRTLMVPPGDTVTPIPKQATRVGTLLGFDADGNPAAYGVATGAAQWQVTDHAIPIGNGAGAVPFGALGPCTAGLLVGWPNASSDPTCQGFTQTGTGAVERTWPAKLGDRISVKDFGATGDGSTNDTAAIQAAFDAAKAAGKSVYIPGTANCYRITSGLTLDYTGVSATGPFVSIWGDGGLSSKICADAGNYVGLTIDGTSGSYSPQVYLRGFGIIKTGADKLGTGLLMKHIVQDSLEDMIFIGWSTGAELQDTIVSSLKNIDSHTNVTGLWFRYIDFSTPNSIGIYTSRIVNNTTVGVLVQAPSTFTMIGGSVETNGSGVATDAGVKITEAGALGRGGALIQGVYFEGNYGGADLYIHNSTVPASYAISGNTFNRITNAGFTTYNIYVDSNQVQTLSITGNGFDGFGTYAADAGRPYIKLSAASLAAGVTVAASGNFYGSATEMPAGFAAGTTTALGPNAGNFTAWSGAANAFSSITLGRTTTDGGFLAAGAAGQPITGTAQGDVTLYQQSAGKKVWLSNVAGDKLGIGVADNGTLEFPQYTAGTFKSSAAGAVSVAAFGQLPGTATNDNASAGNVGEYISATVERGTPVSLTTATSKTVTSISLTAGDWDVSGTVGFIYNGATTVSYIIGGIGLAADTLLATIGSYNQLAIAKTGGNDDIMPVANWRVSVAGTTTVYLIANASFGVNTCEAYGFIRARRVR